MSFVQVLSKIFGNKSQRDLKAIRPIVDKIKAIGPTLEGLSNDELRGRIDAVRADLAAATDADNTRSFAKKSNLSRSKNVSPYGTKSTSLKKIFSTLLKTNSTNIFPKCLQS